MRVRPVLIGMLICAGSGVGALQAQEQEQASDQDRAAIARCLEKAKAAQAGPESCIGAVQKPCLDRPDGASTLGMRECANREALVWDERLNKAYKAALDEFKDSNIATGAGKQIAGPALIRETERDWLAFRDKKCSAAGLPMAGGSGEALLAIDCYLYETGRQTLWLESLSEK